jgi:hypothetical protein
MAAACAHRLCELIGGDCSLAVDRSRGCRPGLWPKVTAPEVLEEVRTLLATIGEGGRDAAVRLAQLVRAEVREERSLLAQLRDDDPEVADVLAPLVTRRRS